LAFIWDTCKCQLAFSKTFWTKGHFIYQNHAKNIGNLIQIFLVLFTPPNRPHQQLISSGSSIISSISSITMSPVILGPAAAVVSPLFQPVIELEDADYNEPAIEGLNSKIACVVCLRRRPLLRPDCGCSRWAQFCSTCAQLHLTSELWKDTRQGPLCPLCRGPFSEFVEANEQDVDMSEIEYEIPSGPPPA
jgi:hypothetical protein